MDELSQQLKFTAISLYDNMVNESLSFNILINSSTASVCCCIMRHSAQKRVLTLAPPLTILSVCDWAILSRIPLMDSSLANRLSALFSTLLRPLKHRSACRKDGERYDWNHDSDIRDYVTGTWDFFPSRSSSFVSSLHLHLDKTPSHVINHRYQQLTSSETK